MHREFRARRYDPAVLDGTRVESPYLQAPGGPRPDFAPLDNIVGLAAELRLTVLRVTLDAPSWDAAPAQAVSVGIPAAAGPYANFAKALVARYGPSATFWSANPTIPNATELRTVDLEVLHGADQPSVLILPLNQ